MSSGHDFGSYFFRPTRDGRDLTGRIAREWLETWGEVRRNEIWKPDFQDLGKQRRGKLKRGKRTPAKLPIAQCMAIDVEMTIGDAQVVRAVLSHRYIRQAELRDLEPDETLRALLDQAQLPPVGFWRHVHEEFCRRLVRERGLRERSNVLEAREKARKLGQLAD